MFVEGIVVTVLWLLCCIPYLGFLMAFLFTGEYHKIQKSLTVAIVCLLIAFMVRLVLFEGLIDLATLGLGFIFSFGGLAINIGYAVHVYGKR